MLRCAVRVSRQVTVFRDLAQAVGAGTILSALSFAWKQSTSIRARITTGANGWKNYAIEGPLYFGSTQRFGELFAPKEDGDDVVLDFSESRVYDRSALEAHACMHTCIQLSHACAWHAYAGTTTRPSRPSTSSPPSMAR